MLPDSHRLPTIADLPDCAGKRALVRLDLNAPVKDGRVLDDFRIRAALPTLALLRERGAKIRVVSHIGRGGDTLAPVRECLEKEHGFAVSLLSDPWDAQGSPALERQREGDIALLENVRRFSEEAANDPAFARRLALLGDFFVNDAFAASHRAHASIVGVPSLLPSFVGAQFAREVEHLSRAFAPPSPSLVVLGGAKFETKLPLLQKMLGIADAVFVGGALANELFEAQGLAIGASLVTAEHFHQEEILARKNLVLPDDVLVAAADAASPGAVLARDRAMVGPEERITDAGPRALERLRALAGEAAFILWNGPLGEYEAGFRVGTEAAARFFAEVTARGAHTVVGGGDTLAAIKALALPERSFSFISTGGGAMLDFLAAGTLPGIEALRLR